MPDAIDAVDPARIPPAWDGRPSARITVLANRAGQVFDFETGNAGAPAVAQAMAARLAERRWSVGYVNESNCDTLTEAMAAAGATWAPANLFPRPGVYLWVADPSGNVAAGRWHPPVAPLGVQDRYQGDIDLSTMVSGCPIAVFGYLDGPVSAWPPAAWTRFTPTADQWAAPAPKPVPPIPPAPPAPPLELIDVKARLLTEGATGPAVTALQTLVGLLTVDGDFGPQTLARVRAYQQAKGLTVDGVVGVHTWGDLLGVPQ